MRPLFIVLFIVAVACIISSPFLLAGCARYQPPGAGIWKAL